MTVTMMVARWTERRSGGSRARRSSLLATALAFALVACAESGGDGTDVDSSRAGAATAVSSGPDDSAGSVDGAPAATSPVRRTPPTADFSPPTVADEPPPLQMITLTARRGAEFDVELIDEISPALPPGAEVRMRVVAPLIQDRRVIVQMNSLIHAKLTAVQTAGRPGEPTVVTVAFRDILLLGQTLPLSASIVRVLTAGEGGTVLGRTTDGHGSRRVAGAAVGVAGGSAIPIAAAPDGGSLPARTRFRLRLDQPLTILTPSP